MWEMFHNLNENARELLEENYLDNANVKKDSVSNGSNQQEQFQVRVGTGTDPLHWVLPHEHLDHCNLAGFATKNQAFQPHNFDSN
jgi:hypothetical protein